MAYLMDLEEGTLFRWLKMPTEIHRVIKQPEDSSGHTITRCVAWQDSQGQWIFASRDSDQTFNPLADVESVSVSIKVNEAEQ